ncbi:MAG: hypothetical protein HQM09_03395 [Candidatus Riflebacteria bacterium]|nr:hypothetical protein [Candidatus Riflebacteria bacterium]
MIKFDIPAAFHDARRHLEDFKITRAILVLHLVDESEIGIAHEDARDDVPIVVFPLARPFAGVADELARHRETDLVNWYQADPWIRWKHQGGDFVLEPSARAVLPRRGGSEIAIDVTAIMKWRFDQNTKSARWDDPGMILMRDPNVERHCQFRSIYGFQAAPDPIPIGSELQIRSPELYLE